MEGRPGLSKLPCAKMRSIFTSTFYVIAYVIIPAQKEKHNQWNFPSQLVDQRVRDYGGGNFHSPRNADVEVKVSPELICHERQRVIYHGKNQP